MKMHLKNGYYGRLEGVVSTGFHETTAVVVGVGAGSYGAEKLARLGPARMRLCDFDVVEPPNLTRTAFTWTDAQQKATKADALAERIRAVNPLVEVEAWNCNLLELSPDAEAALMADAGVVVAGTDDFAAQARVNTLALRYGVPAVFIGIHAGSEGGRILWTDPAGAPCYRCLAPERYAAAEAGNTERLALPGAAGCLFDSQFVDMIAYKVAAAILERGRDSQLGQFYAAMGRRHEIVVRCSPAYAWGRQLWSALLSDLPTAPKPYAQELEENALFAMDSLWLPAAGNDNCPECGAYVAARAEVS